MRVVPFLVLSWVGCSTTSPTRPAPSALPSAGVLEAPGLHGCTLADAQDVEILDVLVSRSAIASNGLEVAFDGITRDEYVDGRFEVLASFRFRRGAEQARRMPSVLAPDAADEVLGSCWRLVQADDRSATIEIARAARAAGVRHLGDGRCEPMPREHETCAVGEGFCVISWGSRGGRSAALWCRGGRWQLEEERNLP
jgi:hypothetical protein